MTGHAVAHRLDTGRLRRLHPGVYTTITGSLTFDQRGLAAVLACGEGSGLADGWAAGLWRMLAEPPGPPTVVRTGPHRRGPAGVHLRSTGRLEVATYRGVAVTTPARTLLDLAASGPSGRLEVAVEEAQALRLVTRRRLEELARCGRPGARAIRALIEDAPGFTRRAAERRLRSLIRTAQLPRRVTTPSSTATRWTHGGPRSGSSSRSTGTPPTAVGRPSSRTAAATSAAPPRATAPSA